MEVVPTTDRHPLPDGALHLLGAVRGVTGAATRVDIGDARVLVDCGVAQGRDARGWVFPEAAREADALILTHGHLDHVGGVPALVEGGWSGPIVGTRATLAMARLVLRDALKLDGRSEGEVDAFLNRFGELARAVPYDCSVHVIGGVNAAFREAGHILGSASVELESARSRVILSGDLGRPDTPILRAPNQVWSDARAVDLVVLESTYGDREHGTDGEAIQAELVRVIQRAVETGGRVLVPAFAIGRTQVLLYHLNTLVEAGRVHDVPVVVDSPMGLAVTRTYAEFRDLYDREALDRLAYGDDPLDFEGLFSVRRAQDSARARDLPGPMVLIASSGMVTGGRIVGHLRELLPLAETTVLFTGFQAPGTPGRAIQDAARDREARGGVPTVRLGGEEVDVRANVTSLPGLSAHADRRELSAWLRAIPGVRRVALHHGEIEAQRSFARWLTSGGR